MFSSFGAKHRSNGLTYFEEIDETLRWFEECLGFPVLIYGSIARHGCGNDVDMIIVGTEEMWLEFKSRVLQKSPSLCGAFIRYEVVHEMLGEPFGELEEQCIMLVDVYIFPPDWATRLDELQAAFPHEDPLFMQSIAEDAKTLGQCAIEVAHRS